METFFPGSPSCTSTAGKDWPTCTSKSKTIYYSESARACACAHAHRGETIPKTLNILKEEEYLLKRDAPVVNIKTSVTSVCCCWGGNNSQHTQKMKENIWRRCKDRNVTVSVSPKYRSSCSYSTFFTKALFKCDAPNSGWCRLPILEGHLMIALAFKKKTKGQASVRKCSSSSYKHTKHSNISVISNTVYASIQYISLKQAWLNDWGEVGLCPLQLLHHHMVCLQCCCYSAGTWQCHRACVLRTMMNLLASSVHLVILQDMGSGADNKTSSSGQHCLGSWAEIPCTKMCCNY